MVNICLRCHKTGHKVSECPLFLGRNDHSEPKAEPDHVANSALLEGFDHSSSQLCERCARFRITDWLTNEDIRDEVVFDKAGTNALGWENKKHNAERWLELGPLHSMLLDASCPLCRMIFSVFPTPLDEESWKAEYSLRPIRSYNMLAAKLPLDGNGLPDEGLGKKYAIYASVNSREDQLSVIGRYFGDAEDQMVYGFESAFALSHGAPTSVRPGLLARERGLTWNPEVVNSWIDRCEGEHSASCRVVWSDQLLICKMIDVSSRQIVSCPPQCRYIALSYVWGGVSPKDGALERGELPQTIEDAITVTKTLGLRYLWVDALCIDQTPSPEKIQQLSMMDVIYNCAWVTIVALHGDNADVGLCGVSPKNPRVPQRSEVVEGNQLLNLFPTLHQELTGATYCARAWTLQEFLLCSRRLLFGKDQIHFVCNTGRYCESIDDGLDPGHVLDRDPAQSDFFLLPDHKEYVKDPVSRRNFADSTFCGLVEMYTDRKMTHDSDSLNAFQGMLSFLEKTMVPQGFVWGLPLKEFPQSIRWYHPRAVKPRRRPDFPSWSYAGWEGQVSYTDKLNLVNGGSSERFDETVDLALSYIGSEGNVLIVEGTLLKLEVRNEPFNDAYIPGTDFLLGTFQEGNFLHKNTLPEGVFDFCVVERLSFRYSPQSPVRHIFYLIMLEGGGDFPTRRTMVRLYIEPRLEEHQEYLAMVKNRQMIYLQ
ncbi:HET-domain-containing protein [Jackrogersella minutella]|nr:HET-domain-containing protein [Jackrogersella minutella]